MVPPHGTAPCRKIYIKQLLKTVKFDFVSRSHLILWHMQFFWCFRFFQKIMRTGQEPSKSYNELRYRRAVITRLTAQGGVYEIKLIAGPMRSRLKLTITISLLGFLFPYRLRVNIYKRLYTLLFYD